MYGSINERRNQIVQNLLKPCIGVYYKRRFKDWEQITALKHAKIVLVTYFYSPSTVDYFRCGFLASNKIFFIHETPIEVDDDVLDHIVHAPHNKLVETCQFWLKKTDAQRANKAREVYKYFKSQYNFDESLQLT